MRDPKPTPADQWSRWDTSPGLPGDWPGLGNDHHDGYEIDRDGVGAVSRNLIKIALDHSAYTPSIPGAYDSNVHWALAREMDRLIEVAFYAFCSFRRDVYTETGMAGLLIERVVQRYDLLEEPLLGDIPLSTLDDRLIEMLPTENKPLGLVGTPSQLYPNGSQSLELAPTIDYSVDNMTAEKATRDFLGSPDNSPSIFLGPFADDNFYVQAANSAVELANALQGRAYDLREAPWYGAAADNAQSALRQIYANATAVAALAGGLATAISGYSQIIVWCRENFQRVADPDRGSWHELWDFGGTPDSRTRDFLAEPNQELMNIYDNMPKLIRENLPGLLITDKSVDDLRAHIHEVRTRPKTSEWQADNDKGWLAEKEPLLPVYEEAEKRFG
ncbi:hypothetical protein AB0J28_25060 [Streptosporangium canum]|uniref:hypothetical protein n=1 Tax=Streptosporangium canum TaxID=324952 RepID=UPI0034124723